jgi:hypothetical protein
VFTFSSRYVCTLPSSFYRGGRSMVGCSTVALVLGEYQALSTQQNVRAHHRSLFLLTGFVESRRAGNAGHTACCHSYCCCCRCHMLASQHHSCRTAAVGTAAAEARRFNCSCSTSHRDRHEGEESRACKGTCYASDSRSNLPAGASIFTTASMTCIETNLHRAVQQIS